MECRLTEYCDRLLSRPIVYLIGGPIFSQVMLKMNVPSTYATKGSSNEYMFYDKNGTGGRSWGWKALVTLTPILVAIGVVPLGIVGYTVWSVPLYSAAIVLSFITLTAGLWQEEVQAAPHRDWQKLAHLYGETTPVEKRPERIPVIEEEPEIIPVMQRDSD